MSNSQKPVKVKGYNKMVVNSMDINGYSQPRYPAQGVLIPNPRPDKFKECNLMTTNLFNKMKEIEMQRNLLIICDPLNLEPYQKIDPMFVQMHFVPAVGNHYLNQ